MVNNNKGFSLVGVLVAAGILGGLFLVVLQLIDNVSNTQISVEAKSDEIELRSSVRMILNNPNHCRVSLAGEGPLSLPTFPVSFNKVDIDEGGEGLDVAFYLADQTGEQRGLKKFNGANNISGPDKSRFGRLVISSIRLIMNNGTGNNYNESLDHSDVGQIHIVVQKKISAKLKREMGLIFDVSIRMSTNSLGESTIISCDI